MSAPRRALSGEIPGEPSAAFLPRRRGHELVDDYSIIQPMIDRVFHFILSCTLANATAIGQFPSPDAVERERRSNFEFRSGTEPDVNDCIQRTGSQGQHLTSNAAIKIDVHKVARPAGRYCLPHRWLAVSLQPDSCYRDVFSG